MTVCADGWLAGQADLGACCVASRGCLPAPAGNHMAMCRLVAVLQHASKVCVRLLLRSCARMERITWRAASTCCRAHAWCVATSAACTGSCTCKGWHIREHMTSHTWQVQHPSCRHCAPNAACCNTEHTRKELLFSQREQNQRRKYSVLATGSAFATASASSMCPILILSFTHMRQVLPTMTAPSSCAYTKASLPSVLASEGAQLICGCTSTQATQLDPRLYTSKH